MNDMVNRQDLITALSIRYDELKVMKEHYQYKCEMSEDVEDDVFYERMEFEYDGRMKEVLDMIEQFKELDV